MRGPRAILLSLTLLAAAPENARAICGEPPPIAVLPRPDSAAPRNTHVWIRTTKAWTQALLCPESNSCDVDPELTLRVAPARGKPSSEVPVQRRQSTSGIYTTFELVPKTTLAADAAHEIWCVDRKDNREPRLVSAFVTTQAIDTTAPIWGGADSGRTHSASEASALRGSDKRVPGVITLDEECGLPLVDVTISAAHDDLTPSEDLRIGVWTSILPTGTASLRLELPDPRLSSAPSKLVLAFGNTDPRTSDFELPDRPRRLGLAVVDLAGNLSRPSVVELTDPAPACGPSEVSDIVHGCVEKRTIKSKQCGAYGKLPTPCWCSPGDALCAQVCHQKSKILVPNWEGPAPAWEEASCKARCQRGHAGSCVRLAGRLFHLGLGERKRAFDLVSRGCELDGKMCDPTARRVCARYSGCSSCSECRR